MLKIIYWFDLKILVQPKTREFPNKTSIAFIFLFIPVLSLIFFPQKTKAVLKEKASHLSNRAFNQKPASLAKKRASLSNRVFNQKPASLAKKRASLSNRVFNQKPASLAKKRASLSNRVFNQKPASLAKKRASLSNRVFNQKPASLAKKRASLSNRVFNQKPASLTKKPKAGKDYLIKKLDDLLKALPPNHKARNPLRLRLAHVLYLKAEENFIKAEAGNCPAPPSLQTSLPADRIKAEKESLFFARKQPSPGYNTSGKKEQLFAQKQPSRGYDKSGKKEQLFAQKQPSRGYDKNEKKEQLFCAKTARIFAKRSLSAYQKIDSVLNARPLLHAEALFKQAYLLRAMEKRSKALSLLKRIAFKRKLDPLLKAKAWFNIGEIQFELYNYSSSLQAFNEVLKRGRSPWRFKAVYQKIWSLSNLSLPETSIEELEAFLKSDLYSSQTELSDQSLKRKLETELVALYSYGQVTEGRLKFLYHFLKQDPSKNTVSKKNERLFNLAQALNRIGRAHDSNTVWRFYISKASGLKEKLKAYSFMLDNDLHLNKESLLARAGPKIEKIFKWHSKIKISKKLNQKIKKQFQKFLNQISQKKADLSIEQKKIFLSLCQKYNSAYPGEAKWLSLSAHLAQSLKKYGLAQDLFQQAALSLKNNQKELKEEMSWKQVEMAELAQDKKRRLEAYDFYIQQGSQRDLIFKAKYQKAYIFYKNKEYQKSADQFFKLALDKNPDKSLRELRLKSAHLSLASLDRLSHQERELAYKAGLFIQAFPKSRKEFIPIYHSALLNTAQKLVLGKDFSRRPVKASLDKNILKAWDILQKISIREADKKTALSYHFNRLLLAKELLKFKPMEQSLKALLSIKNLKKEDQKTVLTWKLWLAELKFDFKEALRIIKILKPKDQSESHLLYMARLSKLAGQSAVPYYKIFIERFPDSPSASAVLTSLIEKSPLRDKKIFLKKYSHLFKTQPEKLAYLVLKTDEGKWDERFIKPYISLVFMKNSSLNLFFQRKSAIESFEKELAKLNYSLPSSGRRLTRALKNYTLKMSHLENKANNLLKSKDWTSQVFILSRWRGEISRFYNSVMDLPLPKGLTEPEQKQYTKLLRERMQVYREHIIQLKNELNFLWSRDFMADYKISLQRDKVFYGPLKWEIKKLLELPDRGQKKQLESILSSLKPQAEKSAKSPVGQARDLYKALKQNPFDKKALIQLLNWEKEKSDSVLSFYLADRIKELKKKSPRIQL